MILHLTLKKEPFDVMVTGEKTTEYRNKSEWIMSRLLGKKYDYVKCVNGYGKSKPFFVARYRGFEIETNPYQVSYSNGLEVKSEKGTVKIYLGEVVEKGNIKKTEPENNPSHQQTGPA
jgi:hypothetical protein